MLAGSDFSGQLSTTFHSSVFMQRLIELCSVRRGSAGAGRHSPAARAYTAHAYTHSHAHTHSIIDTNIPLNSHVMHTTRLRAVSS